MNETNVTNASGAFTFQSSGVEKIFTAAAYSIIFPISLVGNFLAIFIVFKNRCTRSVTNILLVNMFVANLLVTFVVMPYTVAYVFSDNPWIGGTLGSLTCKFIHFAYALPVAASIFSLLLSSIDRFYAVIYPFKRMGVIRNAKISTTFIWVASFICMSPYLYMFTVGLDTSNAKYYCMIDWSPVDTITALRIFYMVIFVLLYVVPLLFMALLYLMIGFKLWNRKIPGNVLANVKRAADRAKKKVVKMLVIVVVVFAVLWLPAHITHMMVYFNFELYIKIPRIVPVMFYWLCHSNSAISPLLVLFLSEKFRSSLLAIFKERSPRRRLLTLSHIKRSYKMTSITHNNTGSMSSIRSLARHSKQWETTQL